MARLPRPLLAALAVVAAAAVARFALLASADAREWEPRLRAAARVFTAA